MPAGPGIQTLPIEPRTPVTPELLSPLFDAIVPLDNNAASTWEAD